jgi:hypothetical protein
VIQNINNLAAERSLSSYDVPQNLVISYGVDLPFGRGRHFLSDAHGVVGVLATGWRANGITSFHSGTPLALLSGAPNDLNNLFGYSTSFAGTNIIRPNAVQGCNPKISGSAQSRLNEWFNTACFTAPGLFSLGDESRTDSRIRTAGVNNWDFSLSKITSLTERAQLQFSAEFYNVFNRVQFGPPNPTLGAGFGVVTSQVNQPRTIQFALRVSF